MKNNLYTYEKDIRINTQHRADLKRILTEKLIPKSSHRWWYIAPLAVGFAAAIFMLRIPLGTQEVNAAELLSYAAKAFVTVPEGKMLRIHRTTTGMIEYEDGREEYGITGGDDIFFDGESYSWTVFDVQMQDGIPSNMLATSLAVLSDNNITYTKYEWIPAGCMESDGEESCYEEQVVSYEMSDEARHEAEIYLRAEERGISLDDSSAIKDIAGELACNEEIDVFGIETSPLYEVLYAQSNLRQIQDYLQGDTWCETLTDCPLVTDQHTGERIPIFLTPVLEQEEGFYRGEKELFFHVTVPYNPAAVSVLMGEEAASLQWEIWIDENGLPSHEILRKNGEEVQGVSYGFDYLDAGEMSSVLTFDGWRESRGIEDVVYTPSFAPWGYTSEEAEYERSLREAACEEGEFPVSRSGGVAAPTVQIPW